MKTKRRMAVAAASLALLPAAALAACGPTSSGASSGGKSISVALSNSYAGNTFRQQMEANFQTAAKAAKAQGKVSKYEVVDANNSANQQISQIQSMILQDYKVILIDASSSTALNGVIAKACSAGITVISLDTVVTAPCAYKVLTPYEASGEVSAQYALNSVHGTGNALMIRGLQGSPIDQEIYAGEQQVLKKYPKVKVVGTVYGSWSNSATQQAVQGILPSLPKINVVLNQGDEGQGAVQAFQSSSKPVPPIMFGNTGPEMTTWAQLVKSDPGYDTTSIDSSPGMVTIALWEAYELTQGATVPRSITVPMIEITSGTRPAWTKQIPANGIATKVYSLADTRSIIAENQKGTVKQFDTSGPGSQ